MKYRITTWLAAALMLSSLHATAASLSDIQVSNGDQQARITLSFVGEPEYSFTPQGKRLVALDIKQTGVLQGLPLQFSGSNLVKSIRAGTPQDTQTLCLLGGSDGRWQNPGGEATERGELHGGLYHQRRSAAAAASAARGGETGRPAAGDAFPDDDARA